MKILYNILSKYHWHLSLWFRKQTTICENCSNYWSLRARSHTFNKAEVKETESKPKEYKAQIRDCKIGGNVTLVHPINAYEAAVGDNCFIGPFVELQKSVKIGNNTRISSHTFICEGVEIGSQVFVAHGVMFINDKNPIANNKDWALKKTVVKDGASIGSNATILPVTIGKNALIGAGAVITKDVPDNAIVVGNPGRILKYKEK